MTASKLLSCNRARDVHNLSIRRPTLLPLHEPYPSNGCIYNSARRARRRVSHFYGPRTKRNSAERPTTEMNSFANRLQTTINDVYSVCAGRSERVLNALNGRDTIHLCTHCRWFWITCDYGLMCWTWIIPFYSTFLNCLSCRRLWSVATAHRFKGHWGYNRPTLKAGTSIRKLQSIARRITYSSSTYNGLTSVASAIRFSNSGHFRMKTEKSFLFL